MKNEPNHRNTDNEDTRVLPPVSELGVPMLNGEVSMGTPRSGAVSDQKRKPVELGPLLAWLIITAGLNWTIWLASSSPAVRVLVGSFSAALVVLLVSNGVRIRRGQR